MRVAGYTATYLIKASWENVKKKKKFTSKHFHLRRQKIATTTKKNLEVKL